MKKRKPKVSKTQPPSPEKSDKVLRELKEHREQTIEKYNKHLNAMHNLFPEEPDLLHKDHPKIFAEIERLIKEDKNTKGNEIDIIKSDLEKQKKINELLLHYIATSQESKRQFDDYIRRFHTYLLQFTQYIAPFAHDLHAEVARQLTVFPVERMDIVFNELTRRMEQIVTDIERLKNKTEDSDDDG